MIKEQRPHDAPSSTAAIPQQLSAASLAPLDRLHRGDAGALRRGGGTDPHHRHGERRAPGGRGVRVALSTPAALRFFLAAEAVGVDLRGWDADWTAARLTIADPDQSERGAA